MRHGWPLHPTWGPVFSLFCSAHRNLFPRKAVKYIQHTRHFKIETVWVEARYRLFCDILSILYTLDTVYPCSIVLSQSAHLYLHCADLQNFSGDTSVFPQSIRRFFLSAFTVQILCRNELKPSSPGPWESPTPTAGKLSWRLTCKSLTSAWRGPPALDVCGHCSGPEWVALSRAHSPCPNSHQSSGTCGGWAKGTAPRVPEIPAITGPHSRRQELMLAKVGSESSSWVESISPPTLKEEVVIGTL